MIEKVDIFLFNLLDANEAKRDESIPPLNWIPRFASLWSCKLILFVNKLSTFSIESWTVSLFFFSIKLLKTCKVRDI